MSMRLSIEVSCTVVLVLASLAWFQGKSDKPGHSLEALGNADPSIRISVDKADSISLQDFVGRYVESGLGLDVEYSDLASEIDEPAKITEARVMTLPMLLRTASDFWGVSSYVSGSSVFICPPEEDPSGRFRSEDTVRYFLEESVFSEVDDVFSSEESMCGPNVLAVIAQTLGVSSTSREIADLAGTHPEEGTSMAGLVLAAEELGLSAVGIRMPLDAYGSINAPVILHMKRDNDASHFILLLKREKDGSYVALDPPMRRVYTREKLESYYTGKALIVGLRPSS